MINNYKKTILEAMDNENLLNEWETDFISNLADKKDDYLLSENQIECLNKIEQKIASGG